MAYSPWGCKELDTTEHAHYHYNNITQQPALTLTGFCLFACESSPSHMSKQITILRLGCNRWTDIGRFTLKLGICFKIRTINPFIVFLEQK